MEGVFALSSPRLVLVVGESRNFLCEFDCESWKLGVRSCEGLGGGGLLGMTGGLGEVSCSL